MLIGVALAWGSPVRPGMTQKGEKAEGGKSRRGKTQNGDDAAGAKWDEKNQNTKSKISRVTKPSTRE